MKKAKEASGWRKLALVLTVLMISLISIGQKQDPIKLHSTGKSNQFVYQLLDSTTYRIIDSTKTIVTYKKGSDTLVIGEVGYIKVGERVLPKSVIEKMLIPLFKEDVETILNQIQEIPAKSANPLTQWLLKFLGLDNYKPNSKQ